MIVLSKGHTPKSCQDRDQQSFQEEQPALPFSLPSALLPTAPYWVPVLDARSITPIMPQYAYKERPDLYNMYSMN